MANLKEVRARITSVGNTQKITRAMKLVSASKLKRAQDRINNMRPYSDKLYTMLTNILESIDVEELSLNFSEERELKKVLMVLVTSDKGLCGPFNSTLIKLAKSRIAGEYADLAQSGNLTLLTIGKKGYDAFKRSEMDLNNDFGDLFNHLNFERAAEVSQFAMDQFLDGHYDKVEVLFAEFKNAATQNFRAEQFLPIQQFEVSEDNTPSVKPDYIFDPEKEALIDELVPKILKTQFFRYLLDSNASEHGSRMVAMEKATENANELIKELKLMYNKERQAAITTEILEIVGGAAALDAG
jgi:F-type H+-transporting ATPase subunit gamma